MFNRQLKNVNMVLAIWAFTRAKEKILNVYQLTNSPLFHSIIFSLLFFFFMPPRTSHAVCLAQLCRWWEVCFHCNLEAAPEGLAHLQPYQVGISVTAGAVIESLPIWKTNYAQVHTHRVCLEPIVFSASPWEIQPRSVAIRHKTQWTQWVPHHP